LFILLLLVLGFTNPVYHTYPVNPANNGNSVENFGFRICAVSRNVRNGTGDLRGFLYLLELYCTVLSHLETSVLIKNRGGFVIPHKIENIKMVYMTKEIPISGNNLVGIGLELLPAEEYDLVAVDGSPTAI